MAGAYPSPTDHRMAYDRDGTQVFVVDASNNVTALTSAQITALNSEGNSTLYGDSPSVRLIWLFPESRQVTGYFAAYTASTGSAGSLEYSNDTTNGVDGTWATLIATPSYGTSGAAIVPNYRTVQATTSTSVKAIRANRTGTGAGSFGWRAFHWYGDATTGQTLHRVALWDPVSNVRITAATLDFGDVQRGSSYTLSFRLKNMSATKTATNTVVAMEALTDTTPTVVSQFQFSLNNTSFTNTVTVASIGPGAISPIIWIRRSTAATATLSAWTARITAVPTTMA